MALSFYYGSGSPFAWRVWLALEHKGIAYEQHTLSFSGGDLRTPEYLSINARAQVPAIVHDGFALAESAAILEYLDDAFATGPKLFPGDARQRAAIRWRVQSADQNLFAAVGRLAQRVIFVKPDTWDAAKIDDAVAKLRDELVQWEPLVAPGDAWLAGDVLTAADFTVYPILALVRRIDVKRPQTAAGTTFGPRVDAWMRRFDALPMTARTFPPHWKS
jgi:glutathione S-transferase